MTSIFRNIIIFWDISKWNRGQTNWDGGSTFFVARRRPFLLSANMEAQNIFKSTVLKIL